MTPYAAPFVRRAVTDPGLGRLILALAAEVTAGTVHHEGPNLPADLLAQRGIWTPRGEREAERIGQGWLCGICGI